MSDTTTQLPEVEVTATPLTAGSGLVLRIEGVDYGGWLAIRVRRDMREAASQFSCEVSERWPGRGDPWPIKPGVACTVLLDGEVVLTGYIDTYAPAFDSRTHRVAVQGRSATADLVDSSVELDGGQLQGLTVAEIAERVLKPFGITLKNNAPAGDKLPDVQLQQGESPYALLERLCRVQGILVSDDGTGGLVLTRIGAKRAASALVQGKNILAASAELDWADRPSSVTIKAQKPNLDDAEDWPDTGNGANGAARAAEGDDDEPADGPGTDDTVVSTSGTATDKDVKRHRPLIIPGDNVMTSEEAAKRAFYEVRRRIGESQRAKVTVQGWRQVDGSLWDTNMMVAITAPWLQGLDRELAIVALEFLKDDQGTRTELELMLPDALLATAEEADRAAKPASGDAQDTKANFWHLAGED